MGPAIADFFVMAIVRAQKINLAAMVADKGPFWVSLRRRTSRLIRYEQLGGQGYRNVIFTPAFDFISAPTKASQAGFTEVQDSEAMVLRHFNELRANRIIP